MISGARRRVVRRRARGIGITVMSSLASRRAATVVFCHESGLVAIYKFIGRRTAAPAVPAAHEERPSMLMRPTGRPPFRADHVGSLLRPSALREAFRRHAAGQIDDAAFGRIQDGCIRDVVALQQDCGLEVVTDGEFRRGSYWGRFVERTDGFEIRKAIFTFRDDRGHEAEFTAPYAAGRTARARPLALDEFEFLRDATRVTAKITLPSPSTMHFYRCTDFADRGVYPDVERFFADLAAIFRQEVAGLVAAGCRYV